MSEVLTMEQAIAESRRCLNCAKPLCRTGCPIENNIPQFIRMLRHGDIGSAYEVIGERSNLPAICGRVCPHEKQCEAHCVRNRMKAPVKIGSLEMFIADFAHKYGLNTTPKTKGTRGKVAVIGSGPAGLTVAGDLAKEDFAVTIFEGQPEPGGVLLFGIPEFRLDKDVVRTEIKQLADIGVEFKCGVLVGPDITVDQLFAQGYDAIFMGTGTALPRTLDVPGKELAGAFTAVYYLQAVRLVSDGLLPPDETLVSADDRVVVIGAGNVGIDAARTAARRGSKDVTIVFNMAEENVTAFPAEVKAALSDGVRFVYLRNTVRYLSSAEMQGLKPGADPAAEERIGGLEAEILEKSADGKFIPTGQKEIIPCDKILVAIGQRPAARIVSTTHGIKVDDHGYVITRKRPYGMTTRAGVFSGGDVVHGPATVVLAMRESKKVAAGIAEYIDAKHLLEDCADIEDGDPVK